MKLQQDSSIKIVDKEEDLLSDEDLAFERVKTLKHLIIDLRFFCSVIKNSATIKSTCPIKNFGRYCQNSFHTHHPTGMCNTLFFIITIFVNWEGRQLMPIRVFLKICC